jgi:aminoglycoside 6'-N-acetyltransferase I
LVLFFKKELLLYAMTSRYGLEIRAATHADAEGLAELCNAAGLAIKPHSLGARLEALHHAAGTVLIAQEYGPPSGLVAIHWYASLFDDHKVAQITALLVAPDARRRGVGRLLVKAASQAARVAGCGVVQSLGADHHAGLFEFYQATGFVRSEACFARPLRKKAVLF